MDDLTTIANNVAPGTDPWPFVYGLFNDQGEGFVVTLIDRAILFGTLARQDFTVLAAGGHVSSDFGIDSIDITADGSSALVWINGREILTATGLLHPVPHTILHRFVHNVSQDRVARLRERVRRICGDRSRARAFYAEQAFDQVQAEETQQLLDVVNQLASYFLVEGSV